MGDATHRFNVKDYYRMGEVGVLQPGARDELLDGIILDMPRISPLHASVVRRTSGAFNQISQDRCLLSVQGPVHLDDYSEPRPDVMLLRPRDDNYSSRHPKPEDVFLLVEVSDSTVETDREVKVPIYGRAGIAEVWIVNLDNNTLEVYREPHYAGYANIQILHRGDKIAPGRFPDAMIEVSDLLRR